MIVPCVHRLKMGLCEGQPQSIQPDLYGRADYVGDSVNQAARFMDAGWMYTKPRNIYNLTHVFCLQVHMVARWFVLKSLF
jgi:hypothetical protein